jgi:syntaxin 16
MIIQFVLMQRSLATDLQALSMDYRKQQKGYLQKLQRQQEVLISNIGLLQQETSFSLCWST